MPNAPFAAERALGVPPGRPREGDAEEIAPLRAVSIVSALVYWIGTLALLGISLLTASMNCDEGCQGPSDPLASGLEWFYFPGSWQWVAIGGLGVVQFILGTGVFALVAKGGFRRLAAYGLTAHAMVAGVLISLSSGRETWWIDPDVFPLLGLGALTALVAVVGSRPERAVS